jgi:hypothetical protein
LQTVLKADFRPSGLPPGAKAVADALGRCIVDAPDLQAELVSILIPQAQQQIAERLDRFGTVVIEAALNLFHNDNAKILDGEIAAEINGILVGRDERLRYSAKAVDHRLKKMGLLSRRLGGVGNGFVLDRATQVHLHEIAAEYGCVGSPRGHCGGNSKLIRYFGFILWGIGSRKLLRNEVRKFHLMRKPTP